MKYVPKNVVKSCFQLGASGGLGTRLASTENCTSSEVHMYERTVVARFPKERS